MPPGISFDTFKEELARLVEAFRENLSHYKSGSYDEPALRNDFLNPLWRALGWDLENRARLPQPLREVELETRVEIRGRKKRADYIFRTDGIGRFVCEAKKPKEELTSKYAYQVQRYAFNLKVLPALLSDFEELHVFIVGGRPDRKFPWEALFRWHFLEYPKRAQQIWDLFARDNVAAGALDRFIASLPKKAVKGKARQGWLIPRKRQRTVDAEFLTYIEEQRGDLARDLVHENKKYPWNDTNLNETIQRILDRILFIRICEDRDINTGRSLERIVQEWRRIDTARPPLYPRLVSHFQSLDGPFNGALFRSGHESEKVRVSDDFLVNLIEDLSSEDSPYLFSTMPVEILGSVYERFIGKVVHVTRGRKVTVERRHEVRKAGGIYYTPRYIADYIVEQTVGKLLEGKNPKEVAKLKILDPACGSGSFLLRAYERICEHYLHWFRENPKREREELCYRDSGSNFLLTTHLKRQIMLDNIFGVDLDQQAVEVTMLSLYLKILEGETSSSLGRQHKLFPKESFLPDLSRNIRLGNSLVQNDFFDLFSDNRERSRTNPFNWKVEFREIMETGGFDAVIGNPPYVLLQNMPDGKKLENYFLRVFQTAKYKVDTYHLFVERGIELTQPGGRISLITPNTFLTNKFANTLRALILDECRIEAFLHIPLRVFKQADVDTVVFVFRKSKNINNEIPVFLLRENTDIPRIEGPLHTVSQAMFQNNEGYVFNLMQRADWEPVIARMYKNSILLGELADAYFGIQTFSRKKYVTDKPRGRKYKPIIDGEDIGRYSLSPRKEYVRFVPSAIKSGGDESVYVRPKIVVRQIGFRPIATIDKKKFYSLNTIYNVTLIKNLYDLEFILGIINSKAITFLWSQRFFDYKETFPKIKKKPLLTIPIPALDLTRPSHKKQHDRLCVLVGRMLQTIADRRGSASDAERQKLDNTLRATDRAIDELVYELYGLTKEEIALVEQATAESA